MSTFAKLLYSVLLFGLLVVILRELWTVWFDRTIYVGRFDVVSEGASEPDSIAFRRRIVTAQAILGQQFTDYQTRRTADAPSDATYIIPGMTPLLLPPETLSGVDVTVQNVNLSHLLTAVRRRFLAPNEVTGSVTVRPGSVLAAVDWPRAQQPKSGQPALKRFLVPGQTSEQGAATYIACSLSWAHAAASDATVAKYSRPQFCDFAIGLGDLYALSEKASSPSGIDANETALVRKRAAQLRAHYGADAILPELYRLRADLLDLLPEQERSQEELVEAQDDRLRYAMLSPKLQNLPEEEKRLAALALARPAILLEDGQLVNAAENWGGLLKRRDKNIRTAAKSVGLIVTPDGTPVGTGSVIAPGLMMTARYVLDAARSFRANRREQADTDADDDEQTLRLCFGPKAALCELSLTLGDVIYREEAFDDGSNVALVALVDHDVVNIPPLSLLEPLPAANSLVGQYVFIVGYPFQDQRMPPKFVEYLLEGGSGRQRLMPGRVLAFGNAAGTRASGGGSRRVFTNDISTSGGTGGGPLFDLSSGRVIGMSFAGVWQGERGKFSYAEPIPTKALRIIARYSRDEREPETGTSPQSAPSDVDD